jgi:SAM-dependent methyltransferase
MCGWSGHGPFRSRVPSSTLSCEPSKVHGRRCSIASYVDRVYIVGRPQNELGDSGQDLIDTRPHALQFFLSAQMVPMQISECAEVHGFLYPGLELAAMDLADNYHRWILDTFRPYLGARVIEVGAGIGSVSRAILTHTSISQFTALEPAENLYPILSHRLQGDLRAHAIRAYLEELELRESVDSLVAVNTMEHIKDDAHFLRCAHRALVSGGTLLLFVPALPRLYGSLDREFGHFRRYLKPGLAAQMDAAGFHVELLRYMNFPGILSWFVSGRILRRKTIPPSNVKFYDRVIVPIVRRLESIVSPPLGQSLLAIGRRA